MAVGERRRETRGGSYGKAKVTLVAEVHDPVGRYRTVRRTVRVTI
jgi:hypothetical protein